MPETVKRSYSSMDTPEVINDPSLRFFACALLLSCVVVLILSWKLWDSYQLISEIKDETSKVHGSYSKLMHYDEVLEMSAQMFALTGEAKWQNRYETFYPLQAAAVEELSSVTSKTTPAEAEKLIGLASRIADAQKQAIQEGASGHLDRSHTRLDHPGYAAWTEDFLEQIQRIYLNEQRILQIKLTRQKRTVFILLFSGLFVFPLCALAWFIVVRLFKKWRKTLMQVNQQLYDRTEDLGRLNQNLDQLVMDRTKDLEKINQALRSEVAMRQKTEDTLKARARELELLNQSLQEARTAMLNVLRDFEQEKARSELLLTSAGEGIFGLDAEGRITFINPAALMMLGYSHEEEIIDRTQHEVAHHTRADGSHYPYESCRIHASIRDGTAHRVNDEVFWKKNGTSFPVEYISTPILSGEGNPVGAVVTFSDISDRKKLQEQLLQSQKMNAVGKLAGGIAHDFNNILLVISGYCEFLEKDVSKSGESAEEIKEIKKAAQRAMDLTRQLLAFSRSQIINPKNISLNEVISGMDKMIMRLIGENIELTTEFESDLWTTKADAGQLEQILVNLVVNARDAMPSGGKLHIETKNERLECDRNFRDVLIPKGEYVTLSVSDSGSGMSEDVRARIFEPFFTTKGRNQGTGLGLSTAYGAIKQNKGFIQVETQLNTGSTFRIYLRRVRVKPSDNPDKDNAEAKELPGGNETVLVVEDETSVRRLAVRLLEELGYEVLEAANGQEALDKVLKCEKNRIHLLLSDVIMPLMGGKELAEKIREIRPEIRTLFISGYTDDTIDKQGVLDEGIELLQKPFTQEKLAFKIRKILDR
ncbi:MAG: response regulator [Candidatus Omnitrophica bacterium]|nr:response regulator [Candidatus Omnitrophota bacterium]